MGTFYIMFSIMCSGNIRRTCVENFYSFINACAAPVTRKSLLVRSDGILLYWRTSTCLNPMPTIDKFHSNRMRNW